MHVLNIRHVLDIILNHSSFEDGSAALKAVSLEVEYAKRELTTGKSIVGYRFAAPEWYPIPKGSVAKSREAGLGYRFAAPEGYGLRKLNNFYF